MMDDAEPTASSLNAPGECLYPSQMLENHQGAQAPLEIDGEPIHVTFVDGPSDTMLPEGMIPTKFFLLATRNQVGGLVTYTPGMRYFKRDEMSRMVVYELAEAYASYDLNEALQKLGTWRRSLINEADQYLEVVDEITVVHGDVMPERLYGCWRLCSDYYVLVIKIQPKMLILYRPGRILLPWLPNGEPSGWNTVGLGSEFSDLDSALRYTRAWKQREAERWSAAIKQYGACPNRRRQ